VILTVLPAAALAQPAAFHSAEQRFELFRQYLARRGGDLTRNQFAGIETLADWKRQRPAFHRQLLYTLGLDPLPPRTPLKARVTGRLARDGYRVEKIVFESKPGMYVTGNLYLPADAAGKPPVVVYVCGHSPLPEGAKVHYQHHGIWFARHGYAAFVLDTIEFGELRGVHHGTHNLGLWYWQSLGYTPAGPEVWNAMRALDYLETRDDVDASQAAITGISGGGAVTWYTAAADERFAVAAPVCATWTAANQTGQRLLGENCDCIYYDNTFQTDLPLVAALIAPRPLKILGAKRDTMFPPAGYHEVYRRLRPIYELYGAGEKVAEYDYDARHSDILPFRKQADEWINRWLKGDTTPFEEGDIRREPAAHLRVLDELPTDTINYRIDRLFINTPRTRPWADLASWKHRRAELLAELKDKVFRAFPKTKAPFDAVKKPGSAWADRYTGWYRVEFSTEEGLRVSGRLFVPSDGAASHPGLISVMSRDATFYQPGLDQLLPALGNHVILELRTRGVDAPADNFTMASVRRAAALVGGTLGSMQIWDILRSVDFLTEHERLKPSSLSVYGRGEMGALALYAAALDERITRVILDHPPTTHWQGPALLNVLRLTDLPEAAGLVAPREIVSLGKLPEAYDYTSSIYALYGKKDRIRQAGALGDALEVWNYPIR